MRGARLVEDLGRVALQRPLPNLAAHEAHEEGEWQRQRVRAAAARGRPKGVRGEGGGDGGAARVGRGSRASMRTPSYAPSERPW